jgi:hypothetical protein
LLRDWPATKGEEYKAAVVACVAAYEKDAPLDDLRTALVRAAKAADIVVPDRREKPMRER